MFGLDKPRMHQTIEAWARRYGPLFKFRIGPTVIVVVADHAAIGVALRDRPGGFRRQPQLERISAEMGLPPGLFGAEGSDWQRQRRIVMAGFDPRHVKAYFTSLVKVTRRLEERWRKAARSGAAIDLQADLMRFTVDAIAGLAFGADINTLESDDDVIQRHLDKIFPALNQRLLTPFPIWRYWKRRADRELEQSVAIVNQAIEGFIDAARARLAAEPARRERPADLLEALITAADAEHGAPLTDRQVAGNVMTMLLAGEDTTANTLAWMIHLLQRNRPALERVADEVRRLGADSNAWTVEDFGRLAYVEACTHETMRLKPVAPAIVLQALRDTTIADLRVPPGTLIWGSMRSDPLDERFFRNPNAFDPARWVHGEADSSSTARVSMPFGAGPRVCPGRHLAMLEMKMALAMLLANFEIESVDTPDGGEAAEELAFTMGPVGLRLRLRERPRVASPLR
jgi:cytochrome P450